PPSLKKARYNTTYSGNSYKEANQYESFESDPQTKNSFVHYTKKDFCPLNKEQLCPLHKEGLLSTKQRTALSTTQRRTFNSFVHYNYSEEDRALEDGIAFTEDETSGEEDSFSHITPCKPASCNRWHRRRNRDSLQVSLQQAVASLFSPCSQLLLVVNYSLLSIDRHQTLFRDLTS
ncbi:hypothetical protein A9K55_008328, partial [Cordyceps militaris]